MSRNFLIFIWYLGFRISLAAPQACASSSECVTGLDVNCCGGQCHAVSSQECLTFRCTSINETWIPNNSPRHCLNIIEPCGSALTLPSGDPGRLCHMGDCRNMGNGTFQCTCPPGTNGSFCEFCHTSEACRIDSNSTQPSTSPTTTVAPGNFTGMELQSCCENRCVGPNNTVNSSLALCSKGCSNANETWNVLSKRCEVSLAPPCKCTHGECMNSSKCHTCHRGFAGEFCNISCPPTCSTCECLLCSDGIRGTGTCIVFQTSVAPSSAPLTSLLSLFLALDYSSFNATLFKATVAASVNIDRSNVEILRVASGSVYCTFQFVNIGSNIETEAKYQEFRNLLQRNATSLHSLKLIYWSTTDLIPPDRSATSAPFSVKPTEDTGNVQPSTGSLSAEDQRRGVPISTLDADVIIGLAVGGALIFVVVVIGTIFTCRWWCKRRDIENAEKQRAEEEEKEHELEEKKKIKFLRDQHEKMPYERRLGNMYDKYDPSRKHLLASAARRYAGREEELLANLVSKYGPEPIPGLTPEGKLDTGEDHHRNVEEKDSKQNERAVSEKKLQQLKAIDTLRARANTAQHQQLLHQHQQRATFRQRLLDEFQNEGKPPQWNSNSEENDDFSNLAPPEETTNHLAHNNSVTFGGELFEFSTSGPLHLPKISQVQLSPNAENGSSRNSPLPPAPAAVDPVLVPGDSLFLEPEPHDEPAAVDNEDSEDDLTIWIDENYRPHSMTRAEKAKREAQVEAAKQVEKAADARQVPATEFPLGMSPPEKNIDSPCMYKKIVRRQNAEGTSPNFLRNSTPVFQSSASPPGGSELEEVPSPLPKDDYVEEPKEDQTTKPTTCDAVDAPTKKKHHDKKCKYCHLIFGSEEIPDVCEVAQRSHFELKEERKQEKKAKKAKKAQHATSSEA